MAVELDAAQINVEDMNYYVHRMERRLVVQQRMSVKYFIVVRWLITRCICVCVSLLFMLIIILTALLVQLRPCNVTVNISC